MARPIKQSTLPRSIPRFGESHSDCWDYKERADAKAVGFVPGVADEACPIDPNESNEVSTYSGEAANINVAVVANFTEPKEIVAAFKQKTDHEGLLRFDVSARLYRQITQCAPFEVLLSADCPEETGRTMVPPFRKVTSRTRSAARALQQDREFRERRGDTQVTELLTLSARFGLMLL
ncbi:substrate-binding domain-containing protein [Bradyrhizobium sp. RDT10]